MPCVNRMHDFFKKRPTFSPPTNSALVAPRFNDATLTNGRQERRGRVARRAYPDFVLKRLAFVVTFDVLTAETKLASPAFSRESHSDAT